MEQYKQELQILLQDSKISSIDMLVEYLQELINNIDTGNYTIINYVPMCATRPLPTVKQIFTENGYIFK